MELDRMNSFAASAFSLPQLPRLGCHRGQARDRLRDLDEWRHLEEIGAPISRQSIPQKASATFETFYPMETPVPPPHSNEPKKRAPLLIENVYEKETTESFVERHFREDRLHRCRCVAEFDVDAIVEQHGPELVRSAQDLDVNPNGEGYSPRWTMMVFMRSTKVFWHFVIKSGNYNAKEPELEYTLTVTANSAEKAAEDALMLQKHFTASDDAPGFFLVRNVKKPRRVPLKPDRLSEAGQGRIGFASS
jgi:hypothetical protein